jgi:hypothetical protein
MAPIIMASQLFCLDILTVINKPRQLKLVSINAPFLIDSDLLFEDGVFPAAVASLRCLRYTVIK